MDLVLQTLGGRIQTPVTFNEEDMGVSLEYVQIQEEIDGAVKALLFDDDMNEIARLCLEDGDWDDPFVQTGGRGRATGGTLRSTERQQTEIHNEKEGHPHICQK